MHELSIATAILDLARRHVPPGCVLKRARVIAGPMRAIEPDAMQFAWQSVIADAGLDEARLTLDLRPWKLRCPQCRSEWVSDNLEGTCPCGCGLASPIGGDELQLTSIEVDDVSKGATPCASR